MDVPLPVFHSTPLGRFLADNGTSLVPVSVQVTSPIHLPLTRPISAAPRLPERHHRVLCTQRGSQPEPQILIRRRFVLRCSILLISEETWKGFYTERERGSLPFQTLRCLTSSRYGLLWLSHTKAEYLNYLNAKQLHLTLPESSHSSDTRTAVEVRTQLKELWRDGYDTARSQGQGSLDNSICPTVPLSRDLGMWFDLMWR